MKKIKITITQEYELPNECSIVNGPGGKLIKCGEVYLSPQLEFMQSNKYSEKTMSFKEMDENMIDLIYESLVSEKEEINET